MDETMSDEEATGAASRMIDENAAGMLENTSLAESAVTQVMDTKAAMDTQVTASDFSSVGKNMIGKVIQGVNSKSAELNTRVKSITDSAQQAMNGQIGTADFYSVGTNMMQGVIDGIGAKEGALCTTMTDIIDKVIDKVEEKYGIQSPSKVMKKLFEYVGEGAVLGLDSKVQAIKNKSEEFASASIDAMAGGLYPGVASNTNMATNNQNIGPIVIQQPVKTPAETARAIKREMVMLLG